MRDRIDFSAAVSRVSSEIGLSPIRKIVARSSGFITLSRNCAARLYLKIRTVD